MNSHLLKLLNFALLLLPAAAFAGEASEVLSTPKSLNLTHHIIGYLSIAVTVLAYVAAMSEESDRTCASPNRWSWVRRSVVGLRYVIYYALHGEAKVAAVAFESNLLLISNCFCLSWCR